MDTNMNMPNTDMAEEPMDSPVKPKKKRHAKLVIFLLVLVLAAGGAGAYYYMERQKPQTTVEDFLSSVQKMDFDAMEALVQSNDLTALDNADVRDPAFAEFFQNVNTKMTYKISRNSFDIQNGTAQVTAHIKYIDGADIYKETISEFLRQIVSTAFSGDALTEEETQQKLAQILIEKSRTMEDKFCETDVTYPLIKTDDQWKIVSLDEETIKIMSANFKSVEDEISQSLSGTEGDLAAPKQAPQAEEGDTIDLDTEKFTIRYTQHRVDQDFAGNPCLMLYYDYTNKGGDASSAMVDVNVQAYQHGDALDAAIPESNEDAVDHFMAEIKPGETVNVCQVFSLQDTSDVTARAGEAFSFNEDTSSSQVLKLQ